ncbi:hypothetical protein [Aeromonas caviae]|uniref:hypothetical protein n=1 Tax=Aeromonas caviae TaxID=648 RepID=UPI0011187CA6|nr:hypothetical protein [Aeromonas caviae]
MIKIGSGIKIIGSTYRTQSDSVFKIDRFIGVSNKEYWYAATCSMCGLCEITREQIMNCTASCQCENNKVDTQYVKSEMQSKSKNFIVYILKIFSDKSRGELIGFKVGKTTVSTNARIESIKKETSYHIEVLLEKNFTTKKEMDDMESLIIQKCQCQFVSKENLRQGYTETFSINDLVVACSYLLNIDYQSMYH